jgi:hypothetical protein
MDRTATTAGPTDPIIEGIACRLDANRVRHRASGDAYVVSVYGEWGIGKTRVLKGLYTRYDAALERLLHAPETDANTPLVIPVLFEAWRYEHEDHLVIPLLKTIEYRLRQVGEASQNAEEAGRGEHAQNVAALKTVGRELLAASALVGRIAYAFAGNIDVGGTVPGIGVPVSVKFGQLWTQIKYAFARWRQRETRPKNSTAPNKNAEMLAHKFASNESLYFESDQALQTITGVTPESPAAQLAFVVLIDDLDRCLPEKAVQVLESVKLFLNVAGFSFVLAVDDEVVERGIAHRYKDYLLIDTGHHGSGNGHAAPISGAEYLEKIVHLPVQLPRWTREQARRFLQQQYPALFGGAATATPKNEDAEATKDEQRSRRPDDSARESGPRDAEALLNLVLNAVPLVPRKLIRLAEALEHLREQFEQLGALAHWRPRHAARLIALQQLYPALYRHVRLRPTRYWRLFETKRNAWDEPQVLLGANWLDLHQLEKNFQQRAPASQQPAPAPEADAPPITAEQLAEPQALLHKVHAAKQTRGAPDPLDLFWDGPQNAQEAADRGLDEDCCNGNLAMFAELYFHGVAPPNAAPPARTRASAAAVPEPAVARIDDVTRFIAGFCSVDRLGRRELIETLQLRGRQLPAAAWSALMTTLRDAGYRALLTDLDWLRDCADILSPEQLLQLYVEHRVLDQIYQTETGAR